MAEHCDELLRSYQELKRSKEALESQYEGIGSYLGLIIDRPTMDSSFDRLSDQQDDILDQIAEVTKALNEVEMKLRDSGCFLADM